MKGNVGLAGFGIVFHKIDEVINEFIDIKEFMNIWAIIRKQHKVADNLSNRILDLFDIF